MYKLNPIWTLNNVTHKMEDMYLQIYITYVYY